MQKLCERFLVSVLGLIWGGLLPAAEPLKIESKGPFSVQLANIPDEVTEIRAGFGSESIEKKTSDLKEIVSQRGLAGIQASSDNLNLRLFFVVALMKETKETRYLGSVEFDAIDKKLISAALVRHSGDAGFPTVLDFRSTPMPPQPAPADSSSAPTPTTAAGVNGANANDPAQDRFGIKAFVKTTAASWPAPGIVYFDQRPQETTEVLMTLFSDLAQQAHDATGDWTQNRKLISAAMRQRLDALYVRVGVKDDWYPFLVKVNNFVAEKAGATGKPKTIDLANPVDVEQLFRDLASAFRELNEQEVAKIALNVEEKRANPFLTTGTANRASGSAAGTKRNRASCLSLLLGL